MPAWHSLPVRPATDSMSSGQRSWLRRPSSGQSRDRHSTRPCFAEKSRRSRPCGRSMHSTVLRSALVRSAGSAGEHGISRMKWDGRKRMTRSTSLWPSYWAAASLRSMRACTGAQPGWVSWSPRPSFSLVASLVRGRSHGFDGFVLWSGRVGELGGNPLFGVVVDGDPLGGGVARPVGDVTGAHQLPLAIESHHPCPVVSWQIEPGLEVMLDFG